MVPFLYNDFFLGGHFDFHPSWEREKNRLYFADSIVIALSTYMFPLELWEFSTSEKKKSNITKCKVEDREVSGYSTKINYSRIMF